MAKRAPKKVVAVPEGGSAATDGGRFPPGTSGNPAGRPKGSKNQVIALKSVLEVGVREQIKLQDVIDVWNATVEAAKDGSMAARKLILDFTLTKPREIPGEDEDNAREYRFVVIDARIPPREEEKPISGETFDNPPQDSK